MTLPIIVQREVLNTVQLVLAFLQHVASTHVSTLLNCNELGSIFTKYLLWAVIMVS